MQHLTAERIAALADEPATLAERAHLGECAACNAELAAAQRLVRMALTDTPAIERPLTTWSELGPALESEGLIRTPMSRDERAENELTFMAHRSSRARRAMQIAAGFFLLVGGGVIGRASAPLADLADGSDASTPGVTASSDTILGSTNEALQVLDRASTDYQRAIAYLAVNDTTTVPMRGRDAATVYQARLEALDRAAAQVRTALYRAPQDQVLNNYYMTTMGARDYTLRQIGEAVPVSNTTRTRY
ncbi:MAG TPA: hypothetical protein VJR92_16285 [Gemmatimonadaceae bacterium]|nr:hypothetical protein [Gemmatimonadaceae bacterium]